MYKYNKCEVGGRLTDAPKILLSEKSDPPLKIAKYSVAVDRGNGVDYIDCTSFGAQAEYIEKYFKKGTPAFIEGKIQTGNYTNKDGVEIRTIDVVPDRISTEKDGNLKRNRVGLIGRLTQDPTITTAEGKDDRASFTLAVPRPVMNADDITDFLYVVCYGKLSKFAEKYLKKGKGVFIEGSIWPGKYKDKDGNQVRTVTIRCSSIDFTKTAASENGNTDAADSAGIDYSDPDQTADVQAEDPVQEPAAEEPVSAVQGNKEPEDEDVFGDLDDEEELPFV